MSRRRLLTLVAVITLAIIGVSLLLITMYIKYLLMPRHFHPLPGAVVFPSVYYGALGCWSHNVNIVIPGNSMVVLNYHVHGNVTINGVVIDIAFPAGIINETLTAFSRLSNPGGAFIIGVYVNSRLIASHATSSPIEGLKFAVSNNGNGYMAVAYTSIEAHLPPINLTSDDVITVLIYSAVPYALPSCAVTNEGEEVGLMVRDGWIGVLPTSNATQAAEQLYEEGKYITEEPAIYIINTTSPMNQLPQELTPGLLAEARPIATGYAPSFIMGYVQLPQYVRTANSG
ncbi:hypothetical protein [Vulcanisaeta sp. JCM 14467]|uniref:hypothetical protein n=1 Tax=Vulcanisaeta sp. JCM 14467 TaxID=1295370 RepID=UPI0006D00CE2|nr:hypothetical protein [Vulcanisaeta sp. JCM 14467]